MEEEEDWGRKRTGGGRGLGEEEDWRRNRTGGGRGLGEEQDWRRNRYIKIFDYFRLVEGDTLAILNMRSKLNTEE